MPRPIKAIILAAGEGRRLKKYTNNLPKGMLVFAGETLIERQIRIFRKCGIKDIVIVKGFQADKIRYPGVRYYMNPDFSSTNMLFSLFCAEEELNSQTVISYSDIIFEQALLKKLMRSLDDITVVVDTHWQKYWLLRYGKIDIDTESLKIDRGNRIIALGCKSKDILQIDGRYVGLMKFSLVGLEKMKKVWRKFKRDFWDSPWQISGRTLKQAFMTDMLQALIDEGVSIYALKTENGWLEFDRNADYEKALKWQQQGRLQSLIRMV